MARDFRADRARFFEIVGSGSSGSAGPGLAIFSASSAKANFLPGHADANIYSNVGNDVFLFVSGNAGKRYTAGGSATLFGGDVVVSGTLYAERQVIEVDEEVTGSLWVSGSLAVSQSVDIHGWSGQIHNLGPYLGLHFTDNLYAQAIGWDGQDGKIDAAIWEATDNLHLSASKQVVILSSSYGTGGGTSLDNRNFADTNFFVSGTIGSRGTLVRATSTFGGDTVVSGTLAVHNAGNTGGTISGSIHHTISGSSYIVAGSGITVESGSNGQITITGTAGGGEWSETGGILHPAEGTPVGNQTVIIGDTTVADAHTIFSKEGGGEFNKQRGSSNTDFVVHGNTPGKTLIDLDQVGAPTNYPIVTVLSGGVGTGKSPNEKTFTDVAFFVSGTKGSTNQPDSRGTALFGGDLVVSGAIMPGSSSDDIYINPGTGIADRVLRREVVQVGEYRTDLGQSVTFYVSGAIGSGRGPKSLVGPGTALFGGDVIIRGELYGGSPLKISGEGLSVSGSTAFSGSVIFSGSSSTEISGSLLLTGSSTITGSVFHTGSYELTGSSFITGSMSITGSLTVSGSSTFTVYGPSIFNEGGASDSDLRAETKNKTHAFFINSATDKVLIHSGGSAISNNAPAASDVSFYASGTNSGNGTGAAKRLTGVSLFEGDVVLSGGLYLSSRIYNEGDHDTYIRPQPDRWRIFAGNFETVDINMSNNQKSTVFNRSHEDIDFEVITDTEGKRGIKVDAANNVVQILSGGAAKSPDESSYADVAFYVSGTARSRGTTTRGTAMFGGDVYASGTIGANLGLSGSLTRLLDGTSYIKAGTNVTVASSSNGAITISSTGGGGSSEWTRASTPDRIYPNTVASTQVLVGGTTIALADILLASDGGAVFNGQNNSVDFRVASNTKPNAIFVDGSTDQVLILSGGAGVSPDISTAGDINFFVSGAIGSKGTAVRGTSVFGGDTVVSGGLHVNASSNALSDFTVESDSNPHMLFVDSSANRISIGTQGASPASLVHIKDTSPEVRIQRQLNGQDSVISFAGSGGVRGSMTGLAAGTNDIVFKTFNGSALEETARFGGDYSGEVRRVIFLSGSTMHVGAMQPTEATDINFFVSGAIGSKGGSTRGTAVFGGDLLVSGVLHISGSGQYQTGNNVGIALNNASSIQRIVWDTPDNSSGVFDPDAQIYEDAGNLYLSASDDVNIRAENGDVNITANGATDDVTITAADDIFLNATADVRVNPGDRLVISEDSGASGKFVEIFGHNGGFRNVLDVGDTGVFINDDAQAQYDFRVESGNNAGMFMVDAGEDIAMFNSVATNKAGESPGLGVDVAVFMSGTRDGINSTGGGTALASGDLFVSGAIYEGDQVLLSMRTLKDCTENDAGLANTEYAVFNTSLFTGVGNDFSDVIPAQNCSIAATGIVSVTSLNHNKRHGQFSFMVRVVAPTSTNDAFIRIRDNGTGGTILWETQIKLIGGGNDEKCVSATVILPTNAKPTLTVQGNGQVVTTKAGSTITFKNA